jgi:hypothetical protein
MLAAKMAKLADFCIVTELAPKNFKALIRRHPYFPNFFLRLCPQVGWRFQTSEQLPSLRGKMISVVSDSPSELPLQETIQKVLNKIWPHASKLQTVISIKLTEQELRQSTQRPSARITAAIRQHFVSASAPQIF